MSDRSALRVVRAGGRGAVCGRRGEVPGGPDAVARAPSWARSDVQRPEPRPDRSRSAVDSAGWVVAAAIRWWAPGPGGRCVVMVAFGRAVLGGAAVCHAYGRAKTASPFIPGWLYCFVAVLEPGATSWTAILDAVRLGPADDATAVTADQLRCVVEWLIDVGQWQAGDPDIVIVGDADYDATRLAWVVRDLPVELVGRVPSDRVMRLPKPPRMRGVNGRPPKHVRNSASPSRRPGPSPQSSRSPTPPTTARPRLRHGTGSTPGSPTVPHGSTTTVNYPWSKAR